MIERAKNAPDKLAERAPRAIGFDPPKIAVNPSDSAFTKLFPVDAKSMRWHRIENFVGKHHAAKIHWQFVLPADSPRQVPQARRETCALPFAQSGTALDDEIPSRQAPRLGQTLQQIGRESA